MTDPSIAQLRGHLATFVVPQTGRPLGTAGTSFDVHVFEGGHVWEASFRTRAGEFLDAVDERRG